MKREEIIALLHSEGEAQEELFRRAAAVRNETIGDGVYLRGLIEYSNICAKNCYYCGIRKDSECDKYTLSDEQILEAAKYAWRNRYGSVVLQGGENNLPAHVDRIERILREIKRLSRGGWDENPNESDCVKIANPREPDCEGKQHPGELGITLSLGEQTLETYRRWRDAGATRYLLRIETSNRKLYAKLHPNDALHDHDRRRQALRDLQSAGYQVGTGVMIGLPFQATDDLADDLLFMRSMDIDMCGMGPYIVSKGTPLEQYASLLKPERWRLEMTLKMVAVLRLLMPNINIAATTALQAIDIYGRIRAVNAGANVVMPNLTPDNEKTRYLLYNNKPMSVDMRIPEENIRYGEWGDSKHFKAKKSDPKG